MTFVIVTKTPTIAMIADTRKNFEGALQIQPAFVSLKRVQAISD